MSTFQILFLFLFAFFSTDALFAGPKNFSVSGPATVYLTPGGTSYATGTYAISYSDWDASILTRMVVQVDGAVQVEGGIPETVNLSLASSLVGSPNHTVRFKLQAWSEQGAFWYDLVTKSYDVTVKYKCTFTFNTTYPAGGTYRIDGGSPIASGTFLWIEGESHTVEAVESFQSEGNTYVFYTWGGGPYPQVRPIVVQYYNLTETALYTLQ